MFTTLIVDDEAIDRRGISYLFEKFGFPVTTLQAGNGMEAIQLLCDREIDILFTDIRMPHMDGLELIARAMCIRPNLKIVIYSAYGEFEYAKSAMNYGVRHYLLKPVVLREFQETIATVIEECRVERQEQIKNEIVKIFLTGQSDWDQPWEYGRSLMLIDFSTPVMQANDQAIFRRIEHEAGVSALSVALNEYQVFVFYDAPNAPGLTDKLLGYFDTVYGGKTTIVLGGGFRSFGELTERYNRMDNLLDKKFFTVKSEVLSADEERELEKSGGLNSAIEADILIYIRRNEKARVKEKIADIFRHGQESGAMSAIYLKYIVVNIARECFTMAGSDKETVSRYMNEVFNCQQLDQLLGILNDIVDNTMVTEEDDTQAAIQKVLHIIQTEYAADISLEQLASRVFLTPSYLSFLFKQETGQTFIKYLTCLRIDKAKELLETTSHKVGMVSELVGYVNVSYFCLLFKNYCGLTPVQYREKHLQEAKPESEAV